MPGRAAFLDDRRALLDHLWKFFEGGGFVARSIFRFVPVSVKIKDLSWKDTRVDIDSSCPVV